MRTYLYWTAFGLRGRFRKNNKLFHEQRMMPGSLWTSLSPRSHTPNPSAVIPAPLCALLPPPLGTSQQKQGPSEARCLPASRPAGACGLTWVRGCEDPAASSAEEPTCICLPHSAVTFHNLEQKVKNLQRQLSFCKVQ